MSQGSSGGGAGITHTMEGDLKVITRETLAQLVPAAAQAQGIDDEDLNIIWYMDQKPRLLSASYEEDEDLDREEWTETNEPELAEWLSQDWDNVAVNVGGQQIVILCGSADDEYGKFWDNSAQEWSDYMF